MASNTHRSTLAEWLHSLGREEPATLASSVAEWLDAAHNQPEWELWGKAQPGAACPAHPLLCHMLDVAAVAARLVTGVLPQQLSARLLQISDSPESSLRQLLFVIALHDLGKALPAFQQKVDWMKSPLTALGYDFNPPHGAKHHGDAGFALVAEALSSRGLSAAASRRLARAVTAHHGQFPTNADNWGRGKAPGPRERGINARWGRARSAIVDCLAGLFDIDSNVAEVDIDHGDVLLVAGLTSVADWLGSMAEVFAYEAPPASAAGYWHRALSRADLVLTQAGFRAPSSATQRSFRQLFPGYSPWPLHRVVDELASSVSEPSLTIIEAPMGEGKTEAALLLAEANAARVGQHGLYVGLPTQATANQMFGRLESFLKSARPDHVSNLLLAHGEASLVERFAQLTPRAIYGNRGEVSGNVRAEGWFLQAKRKLLAEFGVGTIDQALLGVLRTPHAFVRLFGLAGKTVVLDEVHAYDFYTGELMLRLVEWLATLGSSVVLLSATLPPEQRHKLVEAYQRGAGIEATPESQVPYPRVLHASAHGRSTQHFAPRGAPLKIELARQSPDLEPIVQEVVTEAQRGGCVAFVCNTVKRAQDATRLVRERAPNVPRLLLHARLLPEERLAREAQLEAWLGPEQRAEHRPKSCIVIGTQVLEQSLDVDFDLMFSDLAPIDLLLQRAGRMHRHRRDNRCPGRETARFVLVQPDGDWSAARVTQIGEVAGVYDEVIVRLTMRELQGRTSITLPDDIPTLVEAVYAADAAGGDRTLLEPAFRRRAEERGAVATAQARLLDSPRASDDPFANLTCWMKDDDDPLLHQQMKAETRMARPSVNVVCVVRSGDELKVGDGDDTVLDLDKPCPPRLVSRLARRSLKVSTPSLVNALANDPAAQPAGWQKSSILRHRRLLPFVDGVATVAGCTLELDDELGLVITYPRAGGSAASARRARLRQE